MADNWFLRHWETFFSEVTRLILAAAGVVALSLLLTQGFRDHAISQSEQWTRRLPHAIDSLIVAATVQSGTPAENARFADQSQQVRSRANLHLRVMKYFYSRYFASITMATLLAIAAAVCLIHIGTAGWANANRYVGSIFLATVTLAIMFRLSPVLYKQEENIAANKDLYTRYVALDNEMASYAATGIFRDSAGMGLSGVIVRVDSTLFALREIPIGFDRTQIPDYAELRIVE